MIQAASLIQMIFFNLFRKICIFIYLFNVDVNVDVNVNVLNYWLYIAQLLLKYVN